MLALLQRAEATACTWTFARAGAAAQARHASAGRGDLKPLTPMPDNDYERKVWQSSLLVSGQLRVTQVTALEGTLAGASMSLI